MAGQEAALLRAILTAVLLLTLFTPAAILVLHMSCQAIVLCFSMCQEAYVTPARGKADGPLPDRPVLKNQPAARGCRLVYAASIIWDKTQQMKTMTDCGIRDMMKRMGL